MNSPATAGRRTPGTFVPQPMQNSEVSGSTSNTFSKRLVTRIIVLAIGSYMLLSYSSFTRPIWIDEFLHFALGSHRTTAEAWQSISETVPTLNHGQTGIYMLVDYWLLQMGGANLFLLRLPSMLAGVLLLASVTRIAEEKRFGLLGTLLILACFFAQKNLMNFAGEARPYFPLAAATVGTLAFYLVPRERRGFLTNTLGIVSIVLGVAFHPYFPLYWFSLATFGFLTYTRPTITLDCARAFLRHCNLLVSIPAAIAYFTLAKLTWLRGSPVFEMDPFQWVKRDGLLTTFISDGHFQFLGHFWREGLLVIAICAIGFAVPRLRIDPTYRRLAAPILLIALALVLSLALSAISYHRHYWILPRQWVASMALSCVGFVWLTIELAGFLSKTARFLGFPAYLALGFVLFPLIVQIHKATQADRDAVLTAVLVDRTNPPLSAPPLETPRNNDEWVALANANISAGGDVWPIFRRFYARPN